MYESNGFIQIKGLVSDEDYINILKPIKKAINIIEDSNKGKPNRQSELLKQSLGIMFGDYNECMTQSSPMGLSLKSGIISLPKHQGGDHVVKWKKVK